MTKTFTYVSMSHEKVTVEHDSPFQQSWKLAFVNS